MRSTKISAASRSSPTEYQIHAAFVEYVKTKHLADYLIHIPNEGRRSWREGKKQKALGLMKGASDLFLAVPTTRHHGMWHEIKSAKRKETTEQIEFGARMKLKGYEYKCSHSIDEAIANHEEYLRCSP